MRPTSSTILRAGVIVVVLALVAGTAAVFWPGGSVKHVTAYFNRTVGLYAGNDVRVLGAPVGEVRSVEPEGAKVRVEMTYDADREAPANARALVVSPTLVSDRHVQLAPDRKSVV